LAPGTPDTIAAIATPIGRGSVGVIRVSGSAVPYLAVMLLGTMPPPRSARLMRFLDIDGTSIDQGVVLYFPAPNSFTGEHVLELQGHGGPLVMDLVMRRLLGLGCRGARPGEFSERAFLNGKMDVAQAEAIADLIDAGTAAAARAAVRSMQGEFSIRIRELQRQLTDLRAYIEAAIDFPDEELDFLTGPAMGGRFATIVAGFDAVGQAARQGALLREGLRVVIAGRPNVGKSSLLNRLAGEDVAIVSDLPGTTRDLLRVNLQLDGMPLHLVDTAGLRTAGDVVEEEGIRRAKVEIRLADRVLYVTDASEAGKDDHSAVDLPTDLPPGVPVTQLVNKIDLVGIGARLDEHAAMTRVFVSAQTGEGIDLLKAHLKQSAGFREESSDALSARRRHLDSLVRARKLVEDAGVTLAEHHASELMAEDLRLAQQALGEITGEFSSDDLLGEIFSSFCIGK